ncbi:cytidine deaminase-like protein [Gautieria morchelliformis]|nr:cytidine deaminase-like protein [Gautieria morchelliformis]
MFISIVGTRASGKSSLQQYLVSEVDASANKSINLDGDMPLPIAFESPSDLLDHVTAHWRESFVTCDLDTPHTILPFSQRPFFLLVSVDAPMLTRFQRLASQSAPNLALAEFVENHDAMFYGYEKSYTDTRNVDVPQHSPLHHLFRLANVHVMNAFHTLPDLHVHLTELNLTDPDRLRPRWDTYFMTMAALASQRSNCMKRRVGAILVRDKRVVATGYNGTPRNVRNCNEGGCPRCNSGGRSGESLESCLCLHAEENALLEAGRERVGAGSVLYCNTCPCLGCAIKIVQTGVREVVYNLSYKVDDQSAALFNQAGVILRQHSPPQ